MTQIVHNVSMAVVRERIHVSPEQIAAFCRAHHIRWLALFGSVLRDDFRTDSDIDLLYALEPGQTFDRFSVAEELSGLLSEHEADFIWAEDLKWRIRDRVFADTETLYGDPPEEVIIARESHSLYGLNRVKDENLYLGDMLDLAREAREIVADRERSDFDSDRLFHLAVLHLIQTIGEAATHVSQATRTRHPAIPWGDIIGMRNILVHQYGRVDGDTVWGVLTVRLPELLAELEHMLPPDMHTQP